ncbi:MAG: rhodanese-like domain-containing protein, partial [Thermomicrobiales bacterium]
MPTYRDLLDRVRHQIREIDTPTAQQQLADDALTPHPAVIDVREADEVEQGIIPGAVHISRGFLELRVEDAVPDKTQPVIVYCAGGTRSALAAKSLQDLGYTD